MFQLQPAWSYREKVSSARQKRKRKISADARRSCEHQTIRFPAVQRSERRRQRVNAVCALRSSIPYTEILLEVAPRAGSPVHQGCSQEWSRREPSSRNECRRRIEAGGNTHRKHALRGSRISCDQHFLVEIFSQQTSNDAVGLSGHYSHANPANCQCSTYRWQGAIGHADSHCRKGETL